MKWSENGDNQPEMIEGVLKSTLKDILMILATRRVWSSLKSIPPKERRELQGITDGYGEEERRILREWCEKSIKNYYLRNVAKLDLANKGDENDQVGLGCEIDRLQAYLAQLSLDDYLKVITQRINNLFNNDDRVSGWHNGTLMFPKAEGLIAFAKHITTRNFHGARS